MSVWGGYIVDAEQLDTLPHEVQQHTVQIEEGLYLATIGGAETADFINHSCDPNLGLRGQITLVALRDIEVGEEVCFDYAMTDCTPYDEFECRCGMAACRGTVRGNDWKLPESVGQVCGLFLAVLAAPHRSAGAGAGAGDHAAGGQHLGVVDHAARGADSAAPAALILI